MNARIFCHRLLVLMFLIAATARPGAAQTLPVTSGLQLWLKADSGVTTNAAGGVIQWADQSGNVNDALPVSDSQAPLLVARALNNRPVVRFDGVDDFLDVADSDSLSAAGDLTSFFVVKFDDFATFRAVWGKTAGNLPAPTDIYTVPDSGVLRIYRGDGTLNNLGAVDSAQALRANTYLVLGFDVAGDTLTHYLNAQTNGSGIVPTSTADANTSLKIGTRDDFVTRLKGDLAELLIYDRALSPTERNSVFNYLQTKYNLLNLPPSLNLTSQPPGPNATVGQVVTLNATASDLDGSVARVDFFANGAALGSAIAPPYSLRVRIESAGMVQFAARAVDNRSATADAGPITYIVPATGPSLPPVSDGLQLWLRADAGTTTSDNSVVQWVDQSGNGNDALQLDPNLAPILTNNAINGLPAIHFDGVDDYLEVADSDSVSITGDISSFFVLRFSDFATFRAVWAKSAGNLPAPTDMYAVPGNGRLRLYRGNGTGTGIQFVDSALPYPADTFTLGEFVMGGTTLTHYLAGLNNGTGTINVPLADADGPLRIGTRGDFVTRFKGDMAELLIYNRALSQAERREVERYLVEKYGLPTLVNPTNTVPQIAVAAPLGPVLQAPGKVTVSASASDSDGAIVSVQLFANGSLLGTLSNAPYAADLSLNYGGRLTLSARATDNLGTVATSVPVEICVQGPGAPAGLIGYWPFDGDAKASVGLDGTVVGGATPAPDRDGNPNLALALDGAQLQHIEIPKGGGLDGAVQGTISLWVKWTGAQDGGFGGTFGAVLGRQANGRFSDDIINLSDSNPDLAVVQWRQLNPSVATITGGAIVGSDIWHHLAVTFSDTASELFIDGLSEGVGSGGALHGDASIPLAIGAWIGDGGSYATATIDDVAIWDRVLSSDEVQALAARQSTPLNLLLAPDCLTIEQSPTEFVVRWGSTGVLQGAPQVDGPWADIPAATNPFHVPAAAGPQYYRLRSP